MCVALQLASGARALVRFVLDLAPLVRYSGAYLILLAVGLCAAGWAGVPWPVLVALGLLLARSKVRHGRYYARAAWRTRAFPRLVTERFVLRYAAELSERLDLASLRDCCEHELADLSGRFGFSLRGRVQLFILPAQRDLFGLYGGSARGWADVCAGAIAMAADGDLRETLRHELVHLFAGRWHRRPPPLLAEGLSVWLQGEGLRHGSDVDLVARSRLFEPGVRLEALWDGRKFNRPTKYRHYSLAGSFTGFLLRRYGWERYRRLYRCGACAERRFAKVMGVTFADAERQWRDELIAMEPQRRRPGRELATRSNPVTDASSNGKQQVASSSQHSGTPRRQP